MRWYRLPENRSAWQEVTVAVCASYHLILVKCLKSSELTVGQIQLIVCVVHEIV